MPEVAEVRRYVDSLHEFIKDKELKQIEIISGRYQKNLPENVEIFAETLPLKIPKVNCKGKFIYFQFSNDWFLWNTLGLTGSWTKNSSNFSRVAFHFSDETSIYFNDMRNFGTLKFSFGEKALIKKLNSLGPDILMNGCSDELFKAKIQSKFNKTLPEILMDQSVVSGIGNYIKAEALYLSKLSPHRLGGSLSDQEISNLNKAIQDVAKESYRSGGSTFRTYAGFDGEKGEYSERFLVYGRKTDPHQNPVIREETRDKRTTHWVPAIQK